MGMNFEKFINVMTLLGEMYTIFMQTLTNNFARLVDPKHPPVPTCQCAPTSSPSFPGFDC